MSGCRAILDPTGHGVLPKLPHWLIEMTYSLVLDLITVALQTDDLTRLLVINRRRAPDHRNGHPYQVHAGRRSQTSAGYRRLHVGTAADIKDSVSPPLTHARGKHLFLPTYSLNTLQIGFDSLLSTPKCPRDNGFGRVRTARPPQITQTKRHMQRIFRFVDADTGESPNPST